MADGLKVHASIPWALVAMAALALTFQYRDVQHMRAEIDELKAQIAGGSSQAKVAGLEARLDGQNVRLNDVVERVGRLERSRDWESRRRADGTP